MWWQDIREEHRETARELEENCDWTWTSAQNANDLINYKLFLLCKKVANDTVLKDNQTRFLLSPTPEIDVIWNEHMLRPSLYAKMCRVINKDKPVDEQLIDHDPDFAQDKMGVKNVDALSEYFDFITKKSHQLLPSNSTVVPSTIQIIPRPWSLASQLSLASDKDIQFCVIVYKTNIEYSLKIKSTIEMEKVFDTCASHIGMATSAFILLYFNKRINHTDTPESLGMTNDDLIYLVRINSY